MEKQTREVLNPETNALASQSDRPAYEAPMVTVMDETEVLKAFQFTSAATTWWVM